MNPFFGPYFWEPPGRWTTLPELSDPCRTSQNHAARALPKGRAWSKLGTYGARTGVVRVTRLVHLPRGVPPQKRLIRNIKIFSRFFL